MKKKGIEMSLNVIIIAAIGLLILVILAFLVINYVQKTRAGLESCTVNHGGVCMSQSECTAKPGATVVTNTDCTNQKVCCKLIGQ